MAMRYDRETSRAELLSLAPHTMYLPHYLRQLVADTTALPRFGLAAAGAVFLKAAEAYIELFFVVLVFWAVDMLLGILKSLRTPGNGFRWSKAGDGLLRLVVILVLPPVVNLASLIPAGAEGIDLGHRPVIFVLGLMATYELVSILDNAICLFPGLEGIRRRLLGSASK